MGMEMMGALARTVRVDAAAAARSELNRAFFATVDDLARRGRLAQEAACLQHGTTTILLHSIAVAYWCERAALRYGLTEHLEELRRAALLHDYFLYDWHVSDPAHAGHALLHGQRACANAREDFPDLTEREANSISCHMFPLAPAPRYREGWVITCADKVCASYETALRHAPAYPVLRRLCALYVPELALSTVRPAGPAGGLPSALRRLARPAARA